MYKDKEGAIMALKRAAHNKLGHTLTAPKDFALLAGSIEETTGQTVSPSTLMRLWDYVGSDVKPRISTLNALAVYVGSSDFAAFCEGKNDSSDDVLGDHLEVLKQLHERDHLLLRWEPGRKVLVRHLGNAQFVVERVEMSKLQVGDTFTCHLVIAGEPLYLDNLVHGDMAPRRYVCGRHGGVTFEVLRAEH